MRTNTTFSHPSSANLVTCPQEATLCRARSVYTPSQHLDFSPTFSLSSGRQAHGG